MKRIIIGFFGFIFLSIIAAWFTLQHPDIPYAELEKKYAVTASKFIDLPSGIRAHYLDSGSTPTNTGVIVLIHGYSSASFEWSDWIKELKGRYRIIAVDLPAHGLTRTPKKAELNSQFLNSFIDEFTKALNLSEFSIGGISLGASLSWNYSLTHPDKIQSLILVGPTENNAKSKDQPYDPIIYDLRQYPWLEPIIHKLDMKFLIKERIQKSFSAPEQDRSLLLQQLTDFAHAPRHRRNLISLALQEDVSQFMEREFPSRTLIMRGEQDHISPYQTTEKIELLSPASKIITYEMLGHNLHMEAPKRSLDDVLNFLNEKPIIRASSEQELETIGLDENDDQAAK